jgi:hypothetical protein|uniref:Uncharacterized protein n=1 Tax=Myoviridae sp. ctshb19 TaxID=2825194 RepID=A0A8S5UGM5_9CAUD|nr:MAG TPA: hypothetical protein [Myoviridae sp. ctshb19]
MQLVTKDGRLISIWTAEQYALVYKHTAKPKAAPSPFALESGQSLPYSVESFMWWLRDANNGFAAVLANPAIPAQEKVEIYQAGLLVMILLDKLERYKDLLPQQKLEWKIQELPRHATC